MNGGLVFPEGGNGIHTARLVLCLIVLFLCSPEIRATTLEEVPIDHWAYALIDNLQKRGHFGDLYLTNRPYTRGEVAEYCVDLMEERDAGTLESIEVSWVERLGREFGREISLVSDPGGERGEDFTYRIHASGMPRADLKKDDKELDPAYESIKFAGSVDPDFYFRAGFEAALQYRDYFAVVDQVEFTSDPVNDPDSRLRDRDIRWRNFNFPDAYVAGRFGPIGYLFGRSNIIWGSGGRDALTVSSVSPTFDLFKYNVGVRTFRASGFLAFLDKMPFEGTTFNRYLYGHRIDWRAAPWFQLGFSETALVTGVGRGIEFSHLNPLLPYMLTQLEEEGRQVDTDTYASLDGSIYLADRFFFSGELLIDDTFFFRKESNEDYPFQVAFELEADWTGNPLPSWTTLTLSYTRIGSFVYLHRGTATYYSHFGAPIGHILGPDTDRWTVGVSTYLNDAVEIGVDYRQRRRGENRLEPAVSADGHRDDPFPTGVVERRKGAGMRLAWFATDDLHVQGEFVYTSVRNINNEDGRDDTITNLELSMAYLFDYNGAFGGK